MTNRFFSLLLLLGCVLLPSFSSAAPHKIITTFSILGDFVKAVGKDKVVIAIVGPNSDAHIYDPTPQDVKQISQADLIFVNGLDFEGWMERLIQCSGYKGDIVVASRGVPPRILSDPSEGEIIDPHAWHDIQYVQQYVRNIMDTLIAHDPAHKDYYKKNGEAYLEDLRQLDDWVKQEISKIPQDHRKIITAHDAFGYFGDRYGVTFLAPVGLSTNAEPTVQAIVSLIKEIKKLNIKTIFVENISNPKLIQQISEETQAKIGGVIYSDALSEAHEPGKDYLSLMRHNVSLFIEAMQEMTSPQPNSALA